MTAILRCIILWNEVEDQEFATSTLLTSHYELRALGDEGVTLGEVRGGDLALPHAVVVLDVGLPHPQRAVALGHAAVPLVLVLVHPHRGPVLLPPTLTTLNTNIFYKSTIYF